MTEIPEDIRKAAEDALENAYYDKGRGWDERVADIAEAILAERERCLSCQPSTAENPDEDAYQRGRFDGIMEYARAIAQGEA